MDKVRCSAFRSAIFGVLIAVAFCANCFAASPGEGAANKLKARLTDLSEIVPGFKVTDIDLYGIASPNMLGGDNLRPGPFRAKGQILSLFHAVLEGSYSRSYIVVAQPDDSDSTEWLAIDFQMPSTIDRASGLTVYHQVLQLDEFPAPARIIKDTSIRFYNGELDGQRATLIFYANRGFKGVPVDGSAGLTPTRISFSLFELQADLQNVPGLFVRVSHFMSHRKYCNTDLAQWQELGLAMPLEYSNSQISTTEIRDACKNMRNR